jgi:glycosyltransferase involved in cell wall biosynthesis
LRWFVKEILPRIKISCPWVRLRVTGGRVPAGVRSLADPNVVFEGEVSDLGAFYDGLRLAIAPLRFGAGVKVKTVQALQYGVPIVATAIGAEGIDAAGFPAIDVADDPETFAQLVASLLTDPVVWDQRRSAITQLADHWRSGGSGVSWADAISRVLARRPFAEQSPFTRHTGA